MTNKTYPTIAICIPTYNRLHALEICLKTLINSIEKYKNYIKIYITYNISQDNTEYFLHKFIEEYPDIVQIKKSDTLGIDYNMIYSMEDAIEDYIWWLGDDDIVDTELIDYIFTTTLIQDPDLIIIGASDYSQYRKNKQDYIYDNPRSIFSSPPPPEMPWQRAPGIVFGTSIMKNYCKNFIKQSERFFGTYHAYSGLISDALADRYKHFNKTMIIVSDSKHSVNPLKILKSWHSYSNKIGPAIKVWTKLLDPFYL